MEHTISDGDQSKLNGENVDRDLQAVYRTKFDFGLCSHAAEAQTTMMRDEPDLSMASAMMRALGINMSGEEFENEAKKFTQKVKRMEKGFHHLSRLGSYAERALPKQVEELLLKSTKPGTEDRKRFVEKRDTTFRFTPLMSTFYSILNANEHALTDGFESVVQVLLKYGANPFAKDIIGRTVIHIATNVEVPKQRTPRGLSQADLNGCTGYCGGFDVSTGRYVIYLHGGDGNLQPKPLAIKPENVQIISASVTSSPEQPKALVDYETRISSTALYSITMDGKREDMASFLIQNGASIDIGPKDGFTPRTLVSNAMKNLALTTIMGDMKGRPVQNVIQKEIARLDKKAAKSQGDATENESCSSCGKTNKNLLKCTNCLGARYCDRDCQKAHWKQHKKECKSWSPLPLGPPTEEALDRELVSQSIRLVEGLYLDSSSFGGYKSPDMVTAGDLFWIKVSAFRNMFLLCQDETRSCCFVIYKGSETFDAVFQLIWPDFDGDNLISKEKQIIESRHFQAKFEAEILVIYPKSVRIKRSF